MSNSRRRLKQIIILIAIVIFAGFALSARGQEMFSPGNLGEHSEHISKCSACHLPFRGVPDKRCESCHKKVAVQEKNRQGLHGGVAGDCLNCHTIHQNKSGGEGDEAGFDKKSFNHDLVAVFGLKQHQQQSCSACHKHGYGKVKVSACLNCHSRLARDRGFVNHIQALGTDCLKCHDGRGAPKFKHSDNSDFFVGQHQKRECDKCHKKQTYTAISAECQKCHRHKHKTKVSANCRDCHKLQSWKDITFVHNKRNCTDCHAAPANHFGNDCRACHNTKDWREANINHPRLPGEAGEKHNWRSFPCKYCHPRGYSTYSCLKCHRSNNVTDD